MFKGQLLSDGSNGDLWGDLQDIFSENPQRFFQILSTINDESGAKTFKAINIVREDFVLIKEMSIQKEDSKILYELSRCDSNQIERQPNEMKVIGKFLCKKEESVAKIWLEFEYCKMGSLYEIAQMTRLGFSEGEIAFIIEQILQYLCKLQEKGAISNEKPLLNSRDVFLTEKGEVKIFPLPLFSKQRTVNSLPSDISRDLITLIALLDNNSSEDEEIFQDYLKDLLTSLREGEDFKEILQRNIFKSNEKYFQYIKQSLYNSRKNVIETYRKKNTFLSEKIFNAAKSAISLSVQSIPQNCISIKDDKEDCQQQVSAGTDSQLIHDMDDISKITVIANPIYSTNSNGNSICQLLLSSQFNNSMLKISMPFLEEVRESMRENSSPKEEIYDQEITSIIQKRLCRGQDEFYNDQIIEEQSSQENQESQCLNNLPKKKMMSTIPSSTEFNELCISPSSSLQDCESKNNNSSNKKTSSKNEDDYCSDINSNNDKNIKHVFSNEIQLFDSPSSLASKRNNKKIMNSSISRKPIEVDLENYETFGENNAQVQKNNQGKNQQNSFEGNTFEQKNLEHNSSNLTPKKKDTEQTSSPQILEQAFHDFIKENKVQEKELIKDETGIIKSQQSSISSIEESLDDLIERKSIIQSGQNGDDICPWKQYMLYKRNSSPVKKSETSKIEFPFLPHSIPSSLQKQKDSSQSSPSKYPLRKVSSQSQGLSSPTHDLDFPILKQQIKYFPCISSDQSPNFNSQSQQSTQQQQGTSGFKALEKYSSRKESYVQTPTSSKSQSPAVYSRRKPIFSDINNNNNSHYQSYVRSLNFSKRSQMEKEANQQIHKPRNSNSALNYKNKKINESSVDSSINSVTQASRLSFKQQQSDPFPVGEPTLKLFDNQADFKKNNLFSQVESSSSPIILPTSTPSSALNSPFKLHQQQQQQQQQQSIPQSILNNNYQRSNSYYSNRFTQGSKQQNTLYSLNNSNSNQFSPISTSNNNQNNKNNIDFQNENNKIFSFDHYIFEPLPQRSSQFSSFQVDMREPQLEKQSGLSTNFQEDNSHPFLKSQTLESNFIPKRKYGYDLTSHFTENGTYIEPQKQVLKQQFQYQSFEKQPRSISQQSSLQKQQFYPHTQQNVQSKLQEKQSINISQMKQGIHLQPTNSTFKNVSQQTSTENQNTYFQFKQSPIQKPLNIYQQEKQISQIRQLSMNPQQIPDQQQSPQFIKLSQEYQHQTWNNRLFQKQNIAQQTFDHLNLEPSDEPIHNYVGGLITKTPGNLIRSNSKNLYPISGLTTLF